MEGIVYLLSNEAMPSIIKIGMTTRDEVGIRMNELYSSGVPVPFDCAYAARVPDCTQLEQALHNAFGPQRLNPKREFFTIEPEQAIVIIKLLELENVTPEITANLDSNLNEYDRESRSKMKKRRPNMNFREMDIHEGAELVFISGNEVCKVISERRVLFQGEETSLTKATRISSGKDYITNPCPHWTFNGKSLKDIYEKTYPEYELG